MPAANQTSPKSVLLDDYPGETSHHWPRSPATTGHSLTPPGPSPALTTSSSSRIHFLWSHFGRVLFFQFGFDTFLQTADKDQPQDLPPKTKLWVFYSSQTGWSGERCRNPERQPFIYFLLLLLLLFAVTGHLDVLHRLDAVARISHKLTWGHLPGWLSTSQMCRPRTSATLSWWQKEF